jgi:esterase/lipase superfamily enzyme
MTEGLTRYCRALRHAVPETRHNSRRMHVAVRRAMMLLALVLVTACTAQNQGYLVPASSIGSQATLVDMLTVTTREPSDDRGVVFGGDRGSGVSFSNIVVSIPPGREPGTMQWPRSSPGNPETEFTVASLKPLERAELPEWFKSTLGERRRVFVYIHGFNTRFDRAVFRFAQIAHDSDAQAAPVLYSWPSRGQLLDYRRDLDNATYSRSDLANLLEVAANAPAVGEIVILAHSMGSLVAMEALRQVALKQGGVPSKITNVILASPDLDIGIFRRQVEEMGPNRPNITLFVSQADRALKVSARLSRGVTRLGAVDPGDAAYQDQLDGLSGVTILDLTELRTGDRINHSAYAQSPEIVRLIGDRLIEGQVITDSDVSSVGALGTAAGTVVAAPIRIFETGRR